MAAMVSATVQISADEAWRDNGVLTIHDAPEGADAMALAQAAQTRGGVIIHVARDAARAAAMRDALRFFAPEVALVEFPAWDCLPYDRVSPSAGVSSGRMAALGLLSQYDGAAPLIVITSVNAVTQRTPPRDIVAAAAFSARPRGKRAD